LVRGIDLPRPRLAAVRIVDMTTSNAWAEFAAIFRNTRQAFLDHEKSKAELKGLMPEDAKEAFARGAAFFKVMMLQQAEKPLKEAQETQYESWEEAVAEMRKGGIPEKVIAAIGSSYSSKPTPQGADQPNSSDTVRST
jgi:hypothetical protein